MKKILPVLFLLSFLGMMAMPMVASAAQLRDSCILKHDITDIDSSCTSGSTVDASVTSAWGMCCMLDALYTITDWVFVILIAIVVLFIVWGAFTLVTAAGAPDKVSSGRNYIIYALIGLAVALLARALPSIVEALLGV